MWSAVSRSACLWAEYRRRWLSIPERSAPLAPPAPQKSATFQYVNAESRGCGNVMPRAWQWATQQTICLAVVSFRIGSAALFCMKKPRSQLPQLDRRTLLRAGAGMLGAATLAPMLPRIALADTAQAAQLTDS